MTTTLSGSKYRIFCPQECQEPPSPPAPPPQAFELVHEGGECSSNDAGLPSSASVEECAAHCAAANGCKFFSYNAGNNYCFHEYTASRDCPEGFEVDGYDFFALVPAGLSPPPPFAPAGFSINIVVQLPTNGDMTMSGLDVAASLGSLTLNADVSMVVRQAWTIAVFIEGTAEEAVASVLQACQQVSADCTVCDLSDASCTASTGIGARRALEAAPRHAPPRRVLSGGDVELALVRTVPEGDSVMMAVPLEAATVTLVNMTLSEVDVELQARGMTRACSPVFKRVCSHTHVVPHA